MLYFYPRVIGTPDVGLVSDQEGYRWTQRRPPGSWALRGSIPFDEQGLSVDELSRLEGGQLDFLPEKKWVSSLSFLPEGQQPLWKHAMPRGAYGSFVKGLVEKTEAFLGSRPSGYYLDCWVPHRRVFSSITRMAAPDPLLFQDPDGFDASSFKPRGGFCDKIVYDRFGTRTGRLTCHRDLAF